MEKKNFSLWLTGMGLLTVGMILTGCGQKTADNKGGANVNEGSGQSAKNDSGEESFTGKLGDLMKKGKSFKCTTVVDGGEMKYESVYYIDPATERIRAEIKTNMKVDGKDQEVLTHLIADKEYSYTWKEGEKTGTKIDLGDDESMTGDDASEPDSDMSTQGNPMDEDMNLRCEAWKVDNRLFDAPSDVDFQDLSEMMNNMMKGSGVDASELEKYMNMGNQ